MAIEPYRRLFRLPGVGVLLLVGLAARVPTTAMSMALTLHVVETLKLDYVMAGTVTAAITLGMAVGSPLAGRLVDRYGLRPVLIVTTAAQALFWSSAWKLPFPVLTGAALVAGLLALPVFSVVRQCLAAMVPLEQRRTAFSFDSMFVEVSYMTGPALAVAGITVLGSGPTMTAIAVGTAGAGIGLLLLNPPTRSAAELAEPEVRIPRRAWLTPRMVALLGTAAAATFVLTATELAVVGTMKDSGHTQWIGLAVGIWCFYSLLGGFLYGMLSRGFSPLVLIGLIGLLTMPVALVSGGWWWLVLALLPSGLLCAPSLSSTVETLSRWVPAGARGEAMGLNGTALLIGGAASAPIAGKVIDLYGASWAFVVAGAAGGVMVLVALPFWRRGREIAPVAADPAKVPEELPA
ncbi:MULTISPECIES: MFS transporter [Nonomuraea]|uniref:MFS transporter n=1 Tax=Nonomuraea ferruginea TaxID=46174 RepID=A0ABT4T7H2_9ACTN|nr:MFS transporter [Nonomuraea ferruginea]MDA0644951.1 MFS transporter [Nonomuraea ferruginea]